MLDQLPIQPIKDWYVTLFGGRSRELTHDQVGINRHNLEGVGLSPYLDRVSIRKIEDRKVVPLYARRWFEVVPLDESTPDALSKSPHGEAVLSEELSTAEGDYLDLAKNEPIILNSVLSGVLKNPDNWSSLLAANCILKKRLSF